jgi:hypothetical protein
LMVLKAACMWYQRSHGPTALPTIVL